MNDVKSKIEEIFDKYSDYDVDSDTTYFKHEDYIPEDGKYKKIDGFDETVKELTALYTEMVEEELHGFADYLIKATLNGGDTAINIRVIEKALTSYLSQRKETLPVEDKKCL